MKTYRTKETEQLTGITAKNMQFYEKEGLLYPSRNPRNGYREYSEEDIRRLQQIKMLRMLDLPVADIRDIIHGETSLEGCLREQIKKLKEEEQKLKERREVCELFLLQRKGMEDLAEPDFAVLEQELSDYRYMLEKLQRKDKRRFRLKLIPQIFLYLFILAAGIFGIVFMYQTFTEATGTPWLIILFFAVVLIFIVQGIWQSFRRN